MGNPRLQQPLPPTSASRDLWGRKRKWQNCLPPSPPGYGEGKTVLFPFEGACGGYQRPVPREMDSREPGDGRSDVNTSQVSVDGPTYYDRVDR